MAANLETKSLTLRPINAASHPWRRRWFGTLRYWQMQAAGWGGFFLLSISSLLVIHGEQARSDFEDSLAMVIFGVLTTHLVRVLVLGFRKKALSWHALGVRLFVVVLAAGLALGGAMSWASVCMVTRTPQDMEVILQNDGMMAYSEMVTRSMFFVGVWVALYFGIHYYVAHREGAIERVRLTAAAREAELAALKSQLNPHFLFNALNVIRALIPHSLTVPRQAVTSLSELLRASLQHGTLERIPLSHELEMVDHYLGIEQIRHEHRLQVVREIDPEALPCDVPPFAVQTLVENAINHGIAKRKAGGTVAIRVARELNTLCIRIENPGCIQNSTLSIGMGLANVRARLRLLWGGEAVLRLEQSANERVVATLLIPVPSYAVAPVR